MIKFISKFFFILITIGGTAHAELDQNGWTIINPSSDTRRIYVSNSTGSDLNDGLSPDTPKATLAAGKSLLRHGYPDWLQLKCGDSWLNENISLSSAYAGRSDSERMVITSYGNGPRPLIKNGQIFWREVQRDLEFMAIVGLEFYASYRDSASPDFGLGTAATSAITFQVAVNGVRTPTIQNVLIENVKVSKYQIGMQFAGSLTGRFKHMTFNRNVVRDNTGMGMMLSYADGTSLIENSFIGNAWATRDVRVHNVYLTENTNLIALGNIFAYGGNAGLKMSADHVESFTNFIVEDNLFYKNILSMDHSAGPVGDDYVTVTHKGGVVSNNVFLDPGKTMPYNSTNVQTIATYMLNLSDVEFTKNIFAHNLTLGTGETLNFSPTRLVKNILARDNVVFDWQSARFKNSGTYIGNANNIKNFVEENNFPLNIDYADPSRSVANYNVTLGGPESSDDFLGMAGSLSKQNWDGRYKAGAVNDYIREGFTPADENEPPTVPTNLNVSNLKARSFTLSWIASTDNITVAGYDVYKDGILYGASKTNSINVIGVTPSTTYSMTVVAKDLAGNRSTPSSALSVITTADTLSPAAPTDLKVK